MHEAGLMQAALELAAHAAEAAGAVRIRRLVLRVGPLACVEPAALRFAFEALRAGTLAEDAALLIDEPAAQCVCSACGTEFEPRLPVFVCPECGAVAQQAARGAELELASLEIELGEEQPC